MGLSSELISVDVVAFRLTHDYQLQVLTHHTDTDQAPRLPSGRIQPRQDHCLQDTAKRLLSKLTSEQTTYFEQVVTIGDSERDSRGWSLTVVYYALIQAQQQPALSANAQWISIANNQPIAPLAYDHNQLVSEALERLQNKIQYSAIPVYLLPQQFTLSDIAKVFSIILGTAPPLRSIRNRFLSGKLLQDTGLKRYGSNRPATLYTVNHAVELRLFDRLYLTTQRMG